MLKVGKLKKGTVNNSIIPVLNLTSESGASGVLFSEKFWLYAGLKLVCCVSAPGKKMQVPWTM